MIDESTYRTLDAIAARLYKAGVFPRTVQNADVAFAVILAGYELGFAPMASVRGITLVSGKVSLGAEQARAAWGMRANLTAYDAAYAVLAGALDVPLWTRDAKLAAAVGPGFRCHVV